jgi:hypothetical protein
MEQEFKEIEKALNELQELQSCQIASFNATTMPDIEQQSADREKRFSLFKTQINQFIHIAETREDEKAKSMLHFCNNRIAKLLEQNKTLEIKVRTLRDDIKENMKHMSKNRRGIKKYGSSRGRSSNPKVIHITN